MTYLSLLWVLASAPVTAPKPTIAFDGKEFVVSGVSEAVEHVPLIERRPTAVDKVAFRSDEKFVTWDRRGLTIRSGSHTATTRFRDIPTSPRLRTRDAILGTLEAVRHGRSLDASAISGSRRIGKTVYLLVRWEDAPGEPWLEALVGIDLAAERPKPHAVAVLPGLSFSSGRVADNLVAGPTGVAALIHAGSSWGLWSYRPNSEQSEFHVLGDGIKYASAVSPEVAVFVEKTDHGTFAAGSVDLSTGDRADAAESSTLWHVMEPVSPPVAEATDDAGRQILVELSTGAAFDLPDGATARRAGGDVLVWQGGQQPSKAWLYDPTTWRPLAWWRSGA